MDTLKINRMNTKIVAHRGLSGIEAENSNAAFIAAGNRSYYGIETDVHKTKDGKYICTHDDNAKRVTGKDCIIEETNFTDLRSLRLVDRDAAFDRGDLIMPSLAEYIMTCKRYNKVAVLELKNAFDKSDIAEICDIISQLDYLDCVTFISFCYQNLVYLKELYPNQSTQFLTEEYGDDLIDSLLAYNFDLDIEYDKLSEDRINELHSNGIRVNCWTCDSIEEAEQLISWGVDYITTNILE